MALSAIILLLCLGLIQTEVLKLSCQQIRQFVDGHNKRRLLLAKGNVKGQPAAFRMSSVVWDEELSAMADKWAAQNMFKHNPHRKLPSNRFQVGENLHISSSMSKKNLDLDEVLEKWFDEHKNYEFKEISPKNGHYTQMVWSNSVYLGCAVSQFKEDEWFKTLVVCDYGPAGNIIGEKPYQSGWPSNTLDCNARNCSHPYGDKCNNATTYRLTNKHNIKKNSRLHAIFQMLRAKFREWFSWVKFHPF